MTRVRGLSAVLLLATAVLTGCGGSSGGQAASDGASSAKTRQIVIGVPEDLSGALAPTGQEQLHAAQIAAKDVNSTNHAVHVTLVPVDTKSDPSAAVSGVQKLIGRKDLSAIVGFDLSSQGAAVVPLVSQSGTPTIFLQVTGIQNRPKNLFSMAATVDNYIPLDIKYGLKGTNAKSLALIYQDNATLIADASILENQAKQQGMSIAAKQGGSLTQTDFSSQISAVLAKHPDAVAVLALAPQTATITKGLRQAGFKGKILAQQGVTYGGVFRKIAGKDAPGVVFATTWDISGASDAAKKVNETFKAAYPSDPPLTYLGIEAWDAIHIIVDALQKGSSTDEVVNELQTGTFSNDLAMQPSIKFSPEGYAEVHGMAVQFTASGTKLLGKG